MTIRSIRAGLIVALIAGVALIGTQTGSAHHLALRFNLEEMTVTADRIFVGRCVAVEPVVEEIAGGEMMVTRYTFEVERAIKGRLPRRLTFRQMGHPTERATGKGGEVIAGGRILKPGNLGHGMAEYRPGDELVMFLTPNYMGGKLTYPVGLNQGAFRITKLPSGRAVVRNSINNMGLFTAPYNGTRMRPNQARIIFPERDQPLLAEPGVGLRSEEVTRRRGALPADGFIDLVERIVAAHGGQKGAIIE